jgi:ubiquitin-activating enzyme E1 C
MACGPAFAEDAGVPLCTIKNTPRIPEHCILYASVVMWEKEKPFEGASMDTDNMEHMAWLYEQAAARAKAFNIEGVTQMLTLGDTRPMISCARC